MERVSLGNRRVSGFAIGGESVGVPSVLASPMYAAIMTGTAAALLAYTLKAPAWGSVIAGAGAAIVTKYGIDAAAGA